MRFGIGTEVRMRENSIRFELEVLKASDIAIQTPFGTPVTGSPVREAPRLPTRLTRGAGRGRLRRATGCGTSLAWMTIEAT